MSTLHRCSSTLKRVPWHVARTCRQVGTSLVCADIAPLVLNSCESALARPSGSPAGRLRCLDRSLSAPTSSGPHPTKREYDQRLIVDASATVILCTHTLRRNRRAYSVTGYFGMHLDIEQEEFGRVEEKASGAMGSGGFPRRQASVP